MAAHKSMTKDLFQDMGRTVESMNSTNNSAEGDAEGKVTEEIESLCMNCHADVSPLSRRVRSAMTN